MRSLQFIDLFSGAGGLSKGLELAGHRCLLGVDFNASAIETFALNHPHAKSYCGDIRQLSQNELFQLLPNTKVDLVVGGPPCQGFSTVGRGDPSDPRNHLFKEFIRIITLTNPTYVVIENVTGLVAKKNNHTLLSILETLNHLRYFTRVQVVEAQHFQVPSRRKRTLILASKRGIMPLFSAPASCQQYSAKDALDFLNQHFLANPQGITHHHPHKLQQSVKSIDIKRLNHIPSGKSIRYREDEQRYLPPELNLGIAWDKLPEGRLRQARYQRIPLDGPAPTIMTGTKDYFHPTEPRPLTPREAATLQSFPLSFRFKGSATEVFRQVGNAVPPALSYHLGKYFHQIQRMKLPLKTPAQEASLDVLRKDAFSYKELV